MTYLRPGAEVPTKGKGRKLSDKMLRFIDEYFVDLNATAAVLRVPYKTKNVGTARVLAAELLNHPLIRAEIERRTKEKQDKMELRADYLINKLIEIIESPDEKTTDTLRAIELAGKSIALWKERQEISGPDGGAIETERKIKEDVADFTRSLARLTERDGTNEVVEFPKRGGEGGA